MKKLQLSLLLVFVGTLMVFAQGMRRMEQGPMKKIEELERVKLIETLNMDEQTTLKFFARRVKFRDTQSQLFAKSNGILNQMDDLNKSSGKNSEELKKLIDQYLDDEQKIIENRENFIKSLDDILTPDQISRYLVFEKRFREEIRNVIFRERKKGKR